MSDFPFHTVNLRSSWLMNSAHIAKLAFITTGTDMQVAYSTARNPLVGILKATVQPIKLMGRMPTTEHYLPPLYRWGTKNVRGQYPNAATAFYSLSTLSNFCILLSGLQYMNEKRIQGALTFGASNLLGAMGGILPLGPLRTLVLLTSNLCKIRAGIFETAAAYDDPTHIAGNKFKEDNQGKTSVEITYNVARGLWNNLWGIEHSPETQQKKTHHFTHYLTDFPANPFEAIKGIMKVSRDGLQIIGGSVVEGSTVANCMGNASTLLTSNLGLISMFQGLTNPSGLDYSIMISGICQYTSAPFSKNAVDKIDYRRIAINIIRYSTKLLRLPFYK